MKRNKIKAYHIIVALLAIIISACSKIDDYKTKFTSEGLIIYPGKMDSVKIFSGNKRVKLTGLFTSDPNIVKYKVFWNGRQDSLEVPVKRTGGVDSPSVMIPNLPEGLMSFEIRTYDIKGNLSIPVTSSADVYGDLYQSSLINRGITDTRMENDGSATIIWSDVNKDGGVINMEIKYSDALGNLHDTLITSVPTGLITSLPNFKIGSTISYKTSFLPNATAIDTFRVDYQSHGIKADVTSLYLGNTGGPFIRAFAGGRWGTLAAPWISNAGALNKDNGTNGGYTADSRWGASGQINWETWGNTPVVDGKIYQPTSSPLPAGNYTVSFHYYSEIQSNSSVYCIAAPGGSGIPSLPDLSNALGSALLFNGAKVGATSPNTEETKSFSFTLTSPQVVSIGFLGNVVGNGNPGSYFVVQYIKLVKN